MPVPHFVAAPALALSRARAPQSSSVTLFCVIAYSTFPCISRGCCTTYFAILACFSCLWWLTGVFLQEAW
jgi:hypothetical protein